MNSKSRIKKYNTVAYWWRGFQTASWDGFHHLAETEEERKLQQEISHTMWKMKSDIDKFYALKIGEAIVREQK